MLKPEFTELIKKGYAYDPISQLDEDWIMIRSLYNNNYLKNEVTEQKIPKIIHQIWLGSPVPKRYISFMESWKRKNPDWRYILWTDKEARSFPMVNRQLFERTSNLGSKSDILRYEILKQYGGLYIDTDFECLKSFDDFLYLKFFTGLSYDKNLQLYNGLIACTPNNPILVMCVHNLPINLPLGRKRNNILDITGPNFFTKQFKMMVDKNSTGIVCFPMEFFYPLPNNKIGEDPKPFITKNSYCVHYWDVSWMPNKKVIYNKPPAMNQSFLHVR
jgi:mannosyltransferase OCH1-like enzyme